jgi:hypothetical protein
VVWGIFVIVKKKLLYLVAITIIVLAEWDAGIKKICENCAGENTIVQKR